MITTIIFLVLLFAVFGNLIGFALKAAWGIAKVLLFIVFLPVVLIGMAFMGLMYVALPILVIGGIITLIKRLTC